MASQLPRRSRRGFTVVELLIVVVIIGLLVLWTFPRAGVILDHAQVRGARTAMANEYLLARNAARTQNRVAVLRLSGSVMWIELNARSGTAKDTLAGPGGGKWLDLSARYGATVSGGADSLNIDNRGMLTTARNSAVTYTVTRRGWSDSLVINSYGRMTR